MTGHPVEWAGALIARMDRDFNRGRGRTARGAACLALLLVAAGGLGRGVARAGPVAVLLAGASLLARRSLHAHVRAVAEAPDLDAGRRAVARIVGRDVGSLDASGVARAAIESLAENLSDGVVAPALWFALAGLPGIAAYKALNTADSMIGHRTARHAAFGRAAARLDDLANLPAARLTALLIAAASDRPGASLAAALRDAPHHRSPNAGWPEAAMAGALGLRLAGPRRYRGVAVADAWMGDGRVAADRADIVRALELAGRAWALGVCGVGIAAIGLGLSGRRGTRPSS